MLSDAMFYTLRIYLYAAAFVYLLVSFAVALSFILKVMLEQED